MLSELFSWLGMGGHAPTKRMPADYLGWPSYLQEALLEGMMDGDGSRVRAVIARAPPSLAADGLYGLQPLAWLDGGHILTGTRTGAGTLGAVLDTRSHRLRRLGDFSDEASSDGRFGVGSGGNDQVVHLAIERISDGHRVFLRKDACCPDWNR